MDDFLPVLFLVIFLLFVLGGVFFLLLRKSPKLDPQKAKKYIQKINDTKTQDPAHSLISSHKFFVAALSETGGPKQETAAEKIKKIAKKLPNEKKIWHFHRLRNQAAHEVEFGLTKAKAQEAREQFIRALKALS